MTKDSGGAEPPGTKKRKHEEPTINPLAPFVRPYYKKLYPEQCSVDNPIVYIESVNERSIGNNPAYGEHITKHISEIVKFVRMNANKVAITFKSIAAANNFLLNEDFLVKEKLKAYIPTKYVETTAIIKWVPKEMSNEELYRKIESDVEVVKVQRFYRKNEEKVLVPLSTVAITFSSMIPPSHICILSWEYKLYPYVAPLTQCYRCLQFNHPAKICKRTQKCSKCAADNHNYKDCNSEEIKCANCNGPHLAISRDCPIKQKKLEEKKTKVTYASLFGAPPLPSKGNQVTSTATNKPFKTITANKNDKKQAIQQIVENENIINAIINTLVAIGNSTTISNTRKNIKEIFIKSLNNV